MVLETIPSLRTAPGEAGPVVEAEFGAHDFVRSPSGRIPDGVGEIVVVAPEPGGWLRIAGWAGSSRGGPDSLIVQCDDRTLPISILELNHATPWVEGFVPRMANAASAGFRVHVGRFADTDVFRGRLLRVTPVFGGEKGLDILAVVPPAVIEPPTSDELGLVSPNLSVGFQYLALFQEFCGLARDARVLEVGCGVGRMAFALAHHLIALGRYDGFDIVRDFIEVAEKRFASLPHFRFGHVNVQNGEYNRAGRIEAANLRFPHPDGAFDFVFLTSVFTHMRPVEVRHYIDEIQRVLAPGGRCLATAFVVNEEAELHQRRGDALFPLCADGTGWFHAPPPQSPEAAVGFEESEFLRWWTERGFAVDGILRGSWCGRRRFSSFQDIVVASR
jgi:SAM-dependent methyltransferase